MTIPMEIEEPEELALTIDETIVNGGTENYEELINLPTLNGQKIIGNMHESDPTVPTWAKQPQKPKYTADEVGAATLAQVNNIVSEVAKNKVDKITGKGLSSNDFTDFDKNKLDSVEEGATANIGTLTGIKMNGVVKGTSGVIDLGRVIQDTSDKLDKNQDPKNAGKYMAVGEDGEIIYKPGSGGGTSYRAGDGIDITADVISADNSIARKTDIPIIPAIPTKTSELINDNDYISDSDYIHTDNNYTNSDKNKVNNIPTATSQLINDSDFVVDENYEHVDEAKVLSWGFSKGGSGRDVNVIDNLNSVSSTDALSANQGRLLKDKIADIYNNVISDEWTLRTYSVGEYCISDNKLWKCLVQNSERPTEGANWTRTNVAKEVEQFDIKTSENVGGISFRKHGNSVDVYGGLTGLGAETTINKGATSFKPFITSGLYIILPFYNYGSPYIPVGSVWIDANGNIYIYKPSNITSGYVSGSYTV